MWQEYGIDRIAGDGKLRRTAEYVRPASESTLCQYGLTTHATTGEQVPPGTPCADLKHFPPENIFKGFREKLGLSGHERGPQ